MTQELDLITTFGKSDGGTYDWKYKGLDPKLSAPEIKEACELLTKLDICTQNGVKLFDSVITAKVVTIKETIMFDPEHETRGVTYYGETAKKTVEEQSYEIMDETEEAAESSNVKLPSETISFKGATASRELCVPSLASLKQPHQRHVTPLSDAENTKSGIKAGKAYLLPLTSKNKVEKLTTQTQKQYSAPLADSEQPSRDSSVKVGWLQRIFRRKSRNKEDPESPPNDPISRE